jgi:L-idonate 5-dehydrogenase
MKAIVINGKLDLEQVELPMPEPHAGQVRLRMAYAGICGSDLHYYYDGANGEYVVREPLVPGHEVSGWVDHDPSGRLGPGTPVTVHPATFGMPLPGIEDQRHLWPGGSYLGSASTWPHTQGGMSEYLAVDTDMIRVLPDSLSPRRAALAEPLAVGLHAVAVAGGVAGKRVLVSGSGPIGLLTAAAALADAAADDHCTDVLPGPLERARAIGAHSVIDVSTDAVPADEYDVVLECSGVPAAVGAAMSAARRAGVVVQVGMVPNEPRPINLAPMISKELQVRGAFRFNDEIDRAVALLAGTPSIERVITHEMPAEQAADAFAAAKDASVSGKVVVALWHRGTPSA